MKDRLILGIDVGTSAVKAALIDGGGTVVARFSESYPTRRGPGGRAEQDPRDWLRLIDAAIDRFVSGGHGDRITAIGLCSQVNTHVFLDGACQPLLPAILWQDTRAAAQAAALDSAVTPEQRQRWWGAPMPIDASNVLSRMALVAETRPDLWEKTRLVMLPKDLCILHLTGEVTTDPLANIGLVGADLTYVGEVFDLVPGSRGRVAPLVPITEIAGRVRPGRPLAGVPVVSGTMDGWAGIIGAGGAREGASVYLSGTSEILGICAQTIVPTPGAIVFPSAEGLRLHAAPTQSGGDAQMWFCEATGLTPPEMAELVAATPRGPATPLFLPQLEGERAPLWDSDLRAAFLGVSRATRLGDLARAVYEGVACSARHALETLQASAATVSPALGCAGGGFRSEAWSQIRADMLGVDCRILAAREPGILGATMIAGVGTGWFSTLGQANEALVRHDRVFVPSDKAAARSSELFAIYKDAVGANAALARRLSSVAESNQLSSQTPAGHGPHQGGNHDHVETEAGHFGLGPDGRSGRG